MASSERISLNASKVLIADDLEPWEKGMVAMQILFAAVTVSTIRDHWRLPLANRLMRMTLKVFHASCIIDMLLAVLTATQVAVPSPVMAFLCEFFYGQILWSSYCVLYAKQKMLFTSQLGSLLRPDLQRAHRFLDILFKVCFVCYLAVCVFLPFIPTIVTLVMRETDTTQFVRVVYEYPLWVSVLLAVGDTSISCICVAMFMVPLLEFGVRKSQRKGQQQFARLQRPSNEATRSRSGNEPPVSPPPRLDLGTTHTVPERIDTLNYQTNAKLGRTSPSMLAATLRSPKSPPPKAIGEIGRTMSFSIKRATSPDMFASFGYIKRPVKRSTNRIRQTAVRNLYWSVVAVGSTFLFFTFGSALLPQYCSVWIPWGTMDVMLNVYCCRQMFVTKKKKENRFRVVAAAHQVGRMTVQQAQLQVQQQQQPISSTTVHVWRPELDEQ